MKTLPLDTNELQTVRSFAEQIAQEAGDLTLRYFRQPIDVERKADNSPVTVADRESESLLRARILERYPEHAVIGEEFGEGGSHGSPFTWVLDPIDGTKSFVKGIPLYCVLVALLHEQQPLLGVIHNPALGETVSAARNAGCSFQGTPTTVSSEADLSNAWLMLTDPAEMARLQPEFGRRLYDAFGHARTWADAYGYLLVATGRAEAMIDPIMNLWDIAALKPIIEEAGGRFTDIDGKDNPTGSSAIAANPAIHDAVLALRRDDR